MLETFTIATFADRIGQTFLLGADSAQQLSVELVEVTDLTSRGGPEVVHWPRVPFSIVFRGPQGKAVPQGTYRMEHAEIGAFELFIVPIGPDRHGMRYEAVFT